VGLCKNHYKAELLLRDIFASKKRSAKKAQEKEKEKEKIKRERDDGDARPGPAKRTRTRGRSESWKPLEVNEVRISSLFYSNTLIALQLGC